MSPFLFFFKGLPTISNHTEQSIWLWAWCLWTYKTSSSYVSTLHSDYGMVVVNLLFKRAVVLFSQFMFCFFSSLFFLSVIGADAGNGIRVFIPDIGMFMAGLVIWLLCRSLVQKRPPEDMAQYNADFVSEEQVSLFFPFFSRFAFVKHKVSLHRFLDSGQIEICKKQKTMRNTVNTYKHVHTNTGLI